MKNKALLSHLVNVLPDVVVVQRGGGRDGAGGGHWGGGLGQGVVGGDLANTGNIQRLAGELGKYRDQTDLKILLAGV